MFLLWAPWISRVLWCISIELFSKKTQGGCDTVGVSPVLYLLHPFKLAIFFLARIHEKGLKVPNNKLIMGSHQGTAIKRNGVFHQVSKVIFFLLPKNI